MNSAPLDRLTPLFPPAATSADIEANGIEQDGTTAPPPPDAAVSAIAASIHAHGVLQPLLVRHIAGDRYQVIDGHRRLAACRWVQKWRVPIRDLPCTKIEAAVIAITIAAASIPRDEVKLGRLIALARSLGATQAEIEKAMPFATGEIATLEALPQASPAIQRAVLGRKISLATAALILSVPAGKRARAEELVLRPPIQLPPLSFQQTKAVMAAANLIPSS